MKPQLALLTCILLDPAAQAQTRSSADYAITTETLDFGGGTVTSADYAITGSIAPVTGVSENTAPVATVARHGYIGQLYERLGMGLLASNNYPPEEGTTRISAVHTNDDGTNDPIPSAEVAWSVVDGPIDSIDSNGIATTSAVHEHTAATVRGTIGGFDLDLPLFVQDTLPDNYGSYRSDGIGDAWQIQHFGFNNPLGAALMDPDGDGQDNLFEFTAGIIPTDPQSRLLVRIEDVAGEPFHKKLVFSPVFADRTYVVKSNVLLTDVWEPLGSEANDNGLPERTVTDLDATGPRKFYRVEITKP